MAGYLTTSKTVVAKDTYSSYYQQASVDVSVDASGKVSWKITMTNDSGSKQGRGVDLLVKIGGKSIADTGYVTYSDSSNSKWSTYPTGNNTSKSGSFTLSDNSVSSLDIYIELCCMQSYKSSRGVAVTGTLTRTKWTDIGEGEIKIKDNYNNTFNIDVTKGADGENNPAYGPIVFWGYSSDYDSNTGTGTSLNSLTISDPTAATRRVYAKSVTTATHGADDTQTTYRDIKQYIAPSAPGTPVISYNKSKLTVREPWKFTWPAATAANASSPIIGYRIRIMKNGVAITGLGCGKNDTITLDSSNKNNWVDRDSTSCSITFDPVELEFNAGDEVSVGIYSYTRCGENYAGARLHNGGGYSNAQVVSKAYPVQNAGIVHIKEGGSWREGQVYVKVDDNWKEAETVYTKTSAGWKESE